MGIEWAKYSRRLKVDVDMLATSIPYIREYICTTNSSYVICDDCTSYFSYFMQQFATNLPTMRIPVSVYLAGILHSCIDKFIHTFEQIEDAFFYLQYEPVGT